MTTRYDALRGLAFAALSFAGTTLLILASAPPVA